MISKVRDFKKMIDELIALIKIRKGQVSKGSKCSQKVVKVVDHFFREVKPHLSIKYDTTIDSDMQSLLGATHKNSSVRTYLHICKTVAGKLNEIEKQILVSNDNPSQNNINITDATIISTLDKIIPSASYSYQQALNDLKADTRLSWRGPATDLRESLRECIDYLAPDKDVESQEGFKYDCGGTKPTMKQKVRYILKKRGLSSGQIQVPEKAIEGIEDIVGSFARAVSDRASISTHVITNKSEVVRILRWVREVFCEILEI